MERVDLVLRDPGASEIQAIAALVGVLGYDLTQARMVVEKSPCPILAQVPAAEAKTKAAALREAGVHIELVPSADISSGPRSDGVYFSPVIDTIKTGLVWRKKRYRRLALRFVENDKCEEYAVDFAKKTLPSKAVRIHGSIMTRLVPDEVRDLGDGEIEKDGMTWIFVPTTREYSG